MNDANIWAELQVFYLIGFGFFTIESLLSIWVMQVNYNKQLPCYSFDFASTFLFDN